MAQIMIHAFSYHSESQNISDLFMSRNLTGEDVWISRDIYSIKTRHIHLLTCHQNKQITYTAYHNVGQWKEVRIHFFNLILITIFCWTERYKKSTTLSVLNHFLSYLLNCEWRNNIEKKCIVKNND